MKLYLAAAIALLATVTNAQGAPVETCDDGSAPPCTPVETCDDGSAPPCTPVETCDDGSAPPCAAVFDPNLKMWTMRFGANIAGAGFGAVGKTLDFQEFIISNPDGITRAARDWASACTTSLVSNSWGNGEPLDATSAIAGSLTDVVVFWLATEETMMKPECSYKAAKKLYPKPFDFHRYGQVGNFAVDTCIMTDDESLNCASNSPCEACTSPQYAEWKGNSAIAASISAVAAIVALAFF